MSGNFQVVDLNNETPEQACIREVKEETGYDVVFKSLLIEANAKFTYIAEIIGGELCLDTSNTANEDLIEVAWISLEESDKFVHVTTPLLKLYLDHVKGRLPINMGGTGVFYTCIGLMN